MTKFLVSPTCAIFYLLMCTSAEAHHSFAATYDLDRELEVEGVISEFVFKNPHMIISLETTNTDGSVTNWMVEGEAATRYRHAGWNSETFKPGDRIRVSGSGTHDGSPMIYIEEVHLLNPITGDVFATINHNTNLQEVLGGQSEGLDASTAMRTIPLHLENGDPNFTGAWVENRVTSAKPPWARDPDLPYNETGAAVQASWDVANDPQIFCDPAGLVRKSGFTPHPLQIVQYADRIVFNYEEYSGERVVYLGSEIPAASTKSHMGDSVARYEEDSLIIETVNLLSNPVSLHGGYYSDQASVTEIYTRTDDPLYGSQVTTVMTLTDPGYLTEPWAISRTKVYADGYELTETQCQVPLRERGPAISVPKS
jgi:hypothetical protein